MTLQEWLVKLKACLEAVEWSQKYRTLKMAWRECPRADWLLWLVGKMADKPGWPTRKEIVLAACTQPHTHTHTHTQTPEPRRCGRWRRLSGDD